MTIGILSFQGDFKLHQLILDRLNIKNILIKEASELNNIDALIIPGGESTVMSKLINNFNVAKNLKKFSKIKSIYGTCAGAILMSKKINDNIVKPLDIIDVEAIRNSWGRQIDSFTEEIKLTFDNKNKFNATFIRAPKFICLSNKVTVLSFLKKEPVLIRNNKHLISSFHPEIGTDIRIHEYFIKMINGK